MKFLYALVALLISGSAFASTPLAPLITNANYGASVTLADGEYDDATPVVINHSVTIRGSRNAVIHSEIQIIDGATAHFVGVSFEMNKAGAPSHDGFVGDTFPQNGMIVVLSSSLWLDDVEMRSLAGFNKDAVYVVAGIAHLRTVTQFSRIDWRLNTATPVELLYGSYGNFFDISGANLAYNILSGASNSTQGNAAIFVVGGKLTISGANIFNFGTALYGVQAARASYIQCGAGVYTTIQNFSVPIFFDMTPNTKWIAPGNLCGS
ncbi:hypothetical protein [Bacillus cereus]|uniref:hypothetical protein n=1 Tax=Bacillus cereus TaxID=1396 RepID=UPI002B23FF52|nr:hypothetical protein [Bacillus cereus]MEB2589696.1 hypothetical protein [Bacillus cereus]MEB2616595.1 hypothetical protein [Bacillus cereus]